MAHYIVLHAHIPLSYGNAYMQNYVMDACISTKEQLHLSCHAIIIHWPAMHVYYVSSYVHAAYIIWLYLAIQIALTA